MRYILLSIIAILPLVCASRERLTVVDQTDNSPIAAATVFSKGGNILGLTDKNGILDGIADRDMPLTVRCLGYEPLTVAGITDAAKMVPETYELGEFVVTPLDRPILRIVCYIREYTGGVTSTDTLQVFAEHMGDFYIPTTKIKKFKGNDNPRILKSRLYERHASADGTDSVRRPDFRRDDISWLDLVSMPKDPVRETDAILKGAKTDSVAGKYAVATLARKTAGAYTVTTDYLADKKNHSWSPAFFKLLGFTIDLKKMVGTWAYRPNTAGEYRPADLLYGTFAVDVTGRGKWIKKAFNSSEPVQMHGLFEIYPVRCEHLTVEEADRQLHQTAPATKFERSPLATPLPPSVSMLIDRAESR